MEEVPITPKKATPWGKLFAVLTIIFMAGWALALYVEKPAQEKNILEKFNVSGHSFYKLKDGTFGTVIDSGGQKIPIAFYLDPRNASTIPMSGNYTALLDMQKIYITFNPNQQNLSNFGIAAAQLARIPAMYGIKVIGAYSEDANPVDPNVPIKTCKDASETTGIIFLTLGNNTSVYGQDNCFYVVGASPGDLVLAADRLSYALLGLKL